MKKHKIGNKVKNKKPNKWLAENLKENSEITIVKKENKKV